MIMEGRNNPFEPPEEGVTERISLELLQDFDGEDTEENTLVNERIPKQYIHLIHAEANAWVKTLRDRGWTRETYAEEIEHEGYEEACFRLDTNATYYRESPPQMHTIFTAPDLSETDKIWCVHLLNELILSQLDQK